MESKETVGKLSVPAIRDEIENMIEVERGAYCSMRYLVF